jgi:hypothetical protein
MRRILTIIAALGVLGIGVLWATNRPVAESLRFLIDLQATHADVTARWFYTPNPEYETWYDYRVEDEAAQADVFGDSTSLQEVAFRINRGEADKAYRFYVRPVIKDGTGSIARGEWRDDRFIIPAAPAAGLLAKRDMVTSPVIVQNDPAFEQDRGTLWLEFETTSDITTTQGLWSRDASGYDNGGHLTVYIQDGSVIVRIQSDSASFVVQWPIVPNSINQAAVEFGDDTGFNLHVNSAFAMSDPYTGGTVGNDRPIVVGANQWDWQEGRPDYEDPFLGTVRVSEFYMGRYDFSGRWGLPPLPPPPPVDSLAIEVANIDHGQVEGDLEWNGQPTTVDYFSVRFTPILEAAYIVRLVNGDTLDHYGIWKEALIQVGAPGTVQMSDATGWLLTNGCKVPAGSWSYRGDGCFTQAQKIAGNQRNSDCVGGRYWAKHDSEIECNFNIKYAHFATFVFPRGTNPTLRLEVFDEQRQRIGYWERRVS